MNDGTGLNAPTPDKQAGADALREQLAALRRAYTTQLPVKLQKMQATEQALIADESDGTQLLDELHRQVHNLAGSGATYGFPQLSWAARELEIYIKQHLENRCKPDSLVVKTISDHLGRLSGLVQEAYENPESPPESHENKAVPTPQALPAQSPWNTSVRRLLYFLGKDDDALQDLAPQISHFGYTSKTFDDVKQLRQAMTDEPAYAIVINSATQEEIDALQQIPDPPGGASPRIFVSEHGDMNSRLQAVRSGGAAYFTKPVDIGEFINKLDGFAVHDSPSPYRVLIVDDEESLASYYAWVLQGAGMSTAVVNNPLEIMQTLVDFRPELILMDVYMPLSTGLEMATVIRQQEDYVSIPIVFLSAETDINKQLAAMRSGGDDFLTKPIQADHLVSSVTARAQRSRTLRSFMIRDSLTGLLNHTTTKEQLNVEMLRANRAGGKLSFAMIDIDKFKSVNDTYGHLIGDRVIKSMARLLTQRLRKTDIIGRYGGEEFAAILVDTPVEKAEKVLDEIREGFSKITHHSPQGDFTVTFSCGIAQYPDYDDAARLNDAADKALYEAKRSGRNRIVLACEVDRPSG